MADTPGDPNDEGTLITRDNIVAYREWLGNLVAKAVFDYGAINFFIDVDGHLCTEIPEQRTVRAVPDKGGET